ncbi:MAG: nucleoside kinase [Synergistes sp.]|nr:nucleoside kinase [Synergistes sp.]
MRICSNTGDRIKISIKDLGDFFCDRGTMASEILQDDYLKTKLPDRNNVIVCRVNNQQRPLSWKIVVDSTIEFITIDSLEGLDAYQKTLILMLTSAAMKASGVRLRFTQAVKSAQYFKGVEKEITSEVFGKIKDEMRRMVRDHEPISRSVFSLDEAADVMERQGYVRKADIIRRIDKDPIILYSICDIHDFFGGTALATNAADVPVFDLRLFKGGIFLLPPDINSLSQPVEYDISKNTFNIIDKHTQWLDTMKINTMPQIADKIIEGGTRDLILTCEATHSYMLSEIVRKIKDRPSLRLLCMAGPSSSGKTTTSHRIRIQLRTAGINSSTLELDNYFVDRASTPKNPDGSYDFEALEAIDLPLLNKHIEALLNGDEVCTPKFDFKKGVRTEGDVMRLDKDEFLVIEGIHGLNDKLTEKIAADKKFKIFIYPFTGSNIDYHNRVGASDTRLLRRILRDSRTRGHSAETTLKMWPSVVRGASKHIFPYQDCADVAFNTSLAYELCAMRDYIMAKLSSIMPNSPVYSESKRLRSFFEFIPGIQTTDIPNNSILREFIGGSCFE